MMNWLKNVKAVQIADTSGLVKKKDEDKNIENIEKEIPDCHKYIATQEFYKLTSETFAERLKQAKLATEDDIADFV